MRNWRDDDYIYLDTDKTIEALANSGDSFLGKSSEYWAEIIRDHAQMLVDKMDLDELEYRDIQSLGVDE